ncbi:heparan-alpha-glucosaminide N-acetyltransferase domain-containing protein [Rheinheimera texasensis]|uniref:acyltransferase family protein n=1 Tax=Rheinheimera texasensis TaxID=306205 RepID=UPI0032B19A83
MQNSARFYALDVLRGLAIALMILVNTPGSWSHVYSPLLHASWDGFTFADIVFPGFLFVVGAAMAFSLKDSRLSSAVVAKIAKRALLMFGCGLLLNFLSHPDLATLRIPGVLQRIALCYALAALLVLSLPKRGLWAAVLLLLGGYFALLQLSPAPFSLEQNIVRTLDLAVFGTAHVYQGFGVAFDPEGLLSTLPATVNVLLGYLVATGLKGKAPLQAVRDLAAFGAVLVLLALAGHWLWPVNKALWSGTYVALSSGLLLWLLAALVYLVDIRKATKLTEPLRIYGTNPLFIYMLSWMFSVATGRWLSWSTADGTQSVAGLLYTALSSLLPLQAASLVFALLHVVLFWALSLWLYRRQIFIKL